MNGLQINAIIAGVFFGVWPLLMSRSGLTGNTSAAVFAFGALLIVLPFALYESRNPPTNIVWVMAIGASIFGGLGLLAFNGMLQKANRETISSLLVLMMMAQIATPVIYQAVMGGGMTTIKALGFATAILAAFLLV